MFIWAPLKQRILGALQGAQNAQALIETLYLGALQGAQKALKKFAKSAVQNTAVIVGNEKPGPLDRQPPVSTRACLCFLLGTTLVRHFGWLPPLVAMLYRRVNYHPLMNNSLAYFLG